jgi:hypothetical protein
MKFKVGDIIAPRNNLERHIKLLYPINYGNNFWLVEDEEGLNHYGMVEHIEGSSFKEKDKLISMLEKGKFYHTSDYGWGYVRVASKLANTEITRKLYNNKIIEEEKDYLIVAMS